MSYIGTKISKTTFDDALYLACAQYCNETQQARIVENDTYYEVVKIPAPTLEDLRAAKLATLGVAFNQRITGTIDAHDYQMQFDISDALKMQGAIQLLETTGATEGYLTLANDETVYHVPLEVMRAVLIDMLAAYAACHARKQELRAVINAAHTAGELEAVKITWPV